MADNVQPEKQEEKKIIEVVLTPDKQIAYTIHGSHVPTLTYVLKLLEVEIDKMIIDQRIKNATAQSDSGIIIPGKKRHNIIDYLRGK